MDNGVSLADIRKEATLKANCDTYGIEYIVPTTNETENERTTRHQQSSPNSHKNKNKAPSKVKVNRNKVTAIVCKGDCVIVYAEGNSNGNGAYTDPEELELEEEDKYVSRYELYDGNGKRIPRSPGSPYPKHCLLFIVDVGDDANDGDCGDDAND